MLGQLTSSFGARRDPFTLADSLHPGLDVDVDLGAPVHVTADGVVAEAGYHPEYGNVVTVSHGFGIQTRYAHLQRFVVRQGTSVRRGQVVGHAGSTGRSTGTHLHYEVWLRGKRINPVGAKVPQGTVLTGRELAAFKVQKARVDAMLAAEAGTQYAARGQTPRG